MNRATLLCILIGSLAAPLRADDAPVLWPAPGAKDVCPDTPLRMTLTTRPSAGSGKIEMIDTGTNQPVETIDVAAPTATQTIGGLPHYKYYPVIITGNTVAIYPHDHALGYGKTYSVKMDAAAFKSTPDFAAPAGWQFTTRAAAPAAGATELTVAADGSGDFCTLQGALDFIPDGNQTPTRILLKKGVYTELVYFGNKSNLTIVGEDRKQSVVQYANNNRFNSANDNRTYHRGVFLASHCDHLTLANFTLRDTTPRGGSQAEAIILNGTTTSRAILTEMDLYSFQDTLQINGQAYINDCYIEGDVDFMWGTGPCYFENCHCTGTRSKAYYTQIRNTAKNQGYVYHHCVFDGPPGVTEMYLSRIAPKVFPYSEVVLMDCTMTSAVGGVAWLTKPAGDTSNIHFWEYNSHSPDGKPVDVSKRLDCSRQLAQPDDAKTIADYSNPAFVLGNDWTPQVPSLAQTEPAHP